MAQPLALVIDDEPDICELLTLTLGRMDIDTRTANDVASAKSLLGSTRFDLCLTDMRLPDGNGLELVEWMQSNAADVPVAVITAHGNVETAVQALKLGAFDFISKPLDLNNLRNIVENALRVERNKQARGSGLIGESSPMQELREMVNKVAQSQAPVHISGESGTGKELVARLIHDSGPRAVGPFVPVNCGAIPSELMESEFFGHRKGSFTGAVSDKVGLVQSANGGTLFLDEIADLPLPMQIAGEHDDLGVTLALGVQGPPQPRGGGGAGLERGLVDGNAQRAEGLRAGNDGHARRRHDRHRVGPEDVQHVTHGERLGAARAGGVARAQQPFLGLVERGGGHGAHLTHSECGCGACVWACRTHSTMRAGAMLTPPTPAR